MSVCSFCGHSTFDICYKKRLISVIEELITEHNVNCFFVGNNGEYDRCVASALNEMKKRFPHIQCYIVLAYMPGRAGEFSRNSLPTIYPAGLETVHPRYAITHRNRWMVNQSDYIVAYITHDYGGAWQTFRYAKSKKVQIINLAAKKSA